MIVSSSATDIAIDTTPDTTTTSHNGSSPTNVFLNDTTGYTFYIDSTGVGAYRKTTDGGVTWGSAVTINSSTATYKIAVWYDRWTPKNNTGNSIHITTLTNNDVSTTSDDLWYSRLNTADDTLTTIVNATGTNQSGDFSQSENIPSITVATDGVIYMGIHDATDSYVIKCSTSCDTATNWTEAGTNPLDLNDSDYLILCRCLMERAMPMMEKSWQYVMIKVPVISNLKCIVPLVDGMLPGPRLMPMPPLVPHRMTELSAPL